MARGADASDVEELTDSPRGVEALPLDRVRAFAFDLDGTLVDSAPDLAAAANAMLEALGQTRLEEARVTAAIGDGVDVLVQRTLAESLGAEPDAAMLGRGAALFREIYAGRVFEASRVFPGVREGLSALAERGQALGCITNKARRFTAPLLERAGLAKWLSFVECAERPEERKPAPAMLLKACRELGIAPRELLYVGDSTLDVAAARAAGCPVVLVAYGYNRGRPASEAGADAIIASVADLAGMRGVFPTGSAAP